MPIYALLRHHKSAAIHWLFAQNHWQNCRHRDETGKSRLSHDVLALSNLRAQGEWGWTPQAVGAV
jgi:hypothetical protein